MFLPLGFLTGLPGINAGGIPGHVDLIVKLPRDFLIGLLSIWVVSTVQKTPGPP